MATNFEHKGDAVPFIAAGNARSGVPVVLGSFIGVPNMNVASGASGDAVIHGVFSLPKETGSPFAQGDVLDWDIAAKQFKATGSANAGDIAAAGKAESAALDADTTARVMLTPESGNVSTGVVAPTGPVRLNAVDALAIATDIAAHLGIANISGTGAATIKNLKTTSECIFFNMRVPSVVCTSTVSIVHIPLAHAGSGSIGAVEIAMSSVTGANHATGGPIPVEADCAFNDATQAYAYLAQSDGFVADLYFQIVLTLAPA